MISRLKIDRSIDLKLKYRFLFKKNQAGFTYYLALVLRFSRLVRLNRRVLFGPFYRSIVSLDHIVTIRILQTCFSFLKSLFYDLVWCGSAWFDLVGFGSIRRDSERSGSIRTSVRTDRTTRPVRCGWVVRFDGLLLQGHYRRQRLQDSFCSRPGQKP